MFRFLCALLLAGLLSACKQQSADEAPVAESAPPVETAVDLGEVLASAVGHPNRSEADRVRDLQRRPADVLAFAGVQPGMTVLDVFSGGGWYAELLSYVVGAQGQVWAHNPPAYFERFGDAGITKRLADGRLPNVVRHDRPMDAMELPNDTFDFAVAGMVFHDFYWLTPDVNAVLGQIRSALKPGGRFLITDHAAPEGTGAEYAMELEGGQHRIEESFAIKEMEEAGFELIGTSDLLRVPEDDRTRPFFLMEGAFTDRFVLLFQKPIDGS